MQGRSGVWILGDGITPDKKIAAIGIRVSKQTTMHGFAINCCNETAPFMQFIPCGITDAGVTTISEQLGRTVTPADILETLERELIKYQDRLAMPLSPLFRRSTRWHTRRLRSHKTQVISPLSVLLIDIRR